MRTLVVVVGLTMMSAAAALAQPRDTEAAKRHYLLGKDALAKKAPDRGAREFVRACALPRAPAFLKQRGAAYERGGRGRGAAIYYRRYLNEVAKAPDADEIRKKIEKLD